MVQQSASSLALSDKPGNSSNSTETSTKDKPTSKRKRKISGQGSDSKHKHKRSPSPFPSLKKRKRSHSSSASPPPSKKLAKKSPVKNRKSSKETHSTLAESCCSAVDSSVDLNNREGGKNKQSKRKQDITEKVCEDREPVIVYVPRKGKSCKALSAKHSATEQSESEIELESSGRKERPKRRKSKGKSKTQSKEATTKGKGRSAWGESFSLPSLVDFTRLNMASPE